MTSWVSGFLLWLRIPEGSTGPERGPAPIDAAPLRRVRGRAARYRRGYVSTDEADVFRAGKLWI